MRMTTALAAVLALALSGPVLAADDIVLKDQHPNRYVVQAGDTLWDIAARFLRDPWRWPDIWYVNPNIANPHLIFPGDEVVLVIKDGKPQLELRRAGAADTVAESPAAPAESLRTVKLSPEVRRQPLVRAVPSIPMDNVTPFLTRPGVVTDREWGRSPYVVSSVDQRLIAGSGDRILVRGLAADGPTRYSIVRKGDTYRAKPNDQGEALGIQAIYVGEAVVEKFGDPGIARITEASREALIGDRLLPADARELGDNFLPHAPPEGVKGNIISVMDGVSRIGQYQVVVVNVGSREGMERGHVLAVDQAGTKVRDTVASSRGKLITAPDERAGYVLVFRTFERVSYGLVMKAMRDMRLYDAVGAP